MSKLGCGDGSFLCELLKSAPTRSVSIADLQPYRQWALGILAEDPSIAHSMLWSRLEQDHQVTAGNSTMQGWLRSLRQSREVEQALRSVPIKQLETYREWGLKILANNSDISYETFRSRLEADHRVTALHGTMQTWLGLQCSSWCLQTPPVAQPCV